MAFRQQTARPQPRLSFPVAPTQPAAEASAVASPFGTRALEESEEWVLFSPAAASSTARTQTTSTERTPRTAGLSQLSDFGSLDTAAQSDQHGLDDDLTEHGSDVEDEQEELDSLDDGLHAFHEPSEHGDGHHVDQSGGTLLPTHDGLGSFQPSSSMLQQQIREFERRGSRSRPHQRRRSSVQRRLDALEEAEELTEEQERRQRIEKWRLEQSKALLEEIERETRRRCRMGQMRAKEARKSNDATSSHPVSASPEQRRDEEPSSFLQRFTQKVIRDLMGIDESLLSVIFGESLPEEAMSTTPTQAQPAPNDIQREIQNAIDSENDVNFPDTWEHRLLERISRELGVLVHQLSEHPGAFSTFMQTTQEPLPYAGLTSSSSTTSHAARHPSTSSTTPPISVPRPSSSSQHPSDPLFRPTLPQTHLPDTDASLWGIEEEPPVPPPLPLSQSSQLPPTSQAEKEYWERDLDAKMVFRFLLQKFSSRPSSPTFSSDPTHRRASTVSQSSHRAALIRQHHPLVSTEKQSKLPTRSGPSSRPVGIGARKRSIPSYTPRPVVARRPGSSCASQSTRESKRSKSAGSRNYWDIGGSEGRGGGWGEV